MHDTAAKYGGIFLENYVSYVPDIKNGLIVEIGPGPDEFFKKNIEGNKLAYQGFDQLHSDDPTVDYKLDLPDNSADVVISSSCFEHDEMFWVTFLEIMRILKPHGLFYLNAPSNGHYHAYPGDCYRFFPDSAKALEKWGKKNGYSNLCLLERFTGRTMRDVWKDYVAVWVKDAQFAKHYPRRIQDRDSNVDHGWRLHS